MSHAKLRTTRKQLADFLKDPDSIDTFERLVSIVDGLKDGSPLGAGWDAALTAALGAGWDAALTAALGAGWIATLAATVVGVIVESGSNSNGSYIKFSDGTLICRYRAPSMNIGSAFITGLLYDQTPSYTFPAAFIATPDIMPFCESAPGGVGAYWAGFYKNVQASSTVSGSLIMIGNSGGPLYPGYVAHGRWK